MTPAPDARSARSGDRNPLRSARSGKREKAWHSPQFV